jgi:spermidine synthase
MSARKRKTSKSDKGFSKRQPLTPSQTQKKTIDLSKRKKGFWVLVTVFFFSGLCGLIYEVVWSRMLTLVFGNTTHAISAVVAVFMLGLAVGSYLCGRWIPKIKNLLRGYALIEMGVGVYAALFMPILYGVQAIHSILFPLVYNIPVLLNLSRILLSLILLLIPTLLMGATTPLLGQMLTRSAKFVGRDIGALYALNTLGAATGCFFGAFVLIPTLGMLLTMLVGAITNVILGLIVWRLPKGDVMIDAGKQKALLSDEPAPMGSHSVRQYRFVLFAFMGSGFLAFVYEVAWSRALILVFGSSIYAFATILTIYLLGLALGSIFLSRWIDRIKNVIFLFSILQIVIGISIFITTPIIGKLPDYFLSSFANPNISWKMIAFKEFIVCFSIIILPTFASGACFPLVTRICVNHQGFHVGRTVADAYAFNTLGGIIGSLTTGFVLIPSIGVEKTLLLGGGFNLLIASFLIVFATDTKKISKFAWGTGSIAAAIAGIVLLSFWNPRVLNSGVYVDANMMTGNSKSKNVDSFMSTFELVFHREGSSATVTVFQKDNIRFLRVNGKTDGSTFSDNYTQILLGLLPIMYSRNPESALVIGLGTGMTLASVLDYPMKKVDCVEISPEVVEASRFFNEDNGFALNSPATHLHILDGRTWLMAMPDTYDMIISEPSHPWQTGNANLFTIDFFNLAIKKLKKGGILCQWLPTYHMEKEHFRLLVSSLKKVFPYVHIWMATTDALIIASRDTPPSIDYVELQKRMSMLKIREKLAKTEIYTPEDFLSFFYLDNDAVDKFVEGTIGVNSDNYPVLEFSAPKYLVGRFTPETLLSFLRLSSRSKLPLVNIEDVAEIRRRGIQHRARYFRQWAFPEDIIQWMLRQS